MKHIAAASLVLVCSCFTAPAGGSGAGDAARARDALLALMKSDASIFEGADPDRFREVALIPNADGTFSWGAFIIEPKKRFYAATLDGICTVWFYDGKFDVSDSGEWTAQHPTVLHGMKELPENKGDGGAQQEIQR